jgi:hypothetical protein
MEQNVTSAYSMDIAHLVSDEIDHAAISNQDTVPFHHDLQYFCQDQQNTLDELFPTTTTDYRPFAPDHKFGRILQKVYEAASDCLPKDLITREDFFDGSSTFLHFVAAKGRVDGVMKGVLGFCWYHGHPVDDDRSATCSTALHVAVRHDRFENVMLLVKAGARTDKVDETDTPGELPLHVAIRTSTTHELVAYLIQHNKYAVSQRVRKPSEREGQVAVDLAIARLLHDLAHSNGRDCTRSTALILQALLAVLQGTQLLKDTQYLLAHARQDSHLFLRACVKVKMLAHSRTLHETMLAVLGESEMERQGPGFLCDQELIGRYASLGGSM